mgnify:CR=1 FL=1
MSDAHSSPLRVLVFAIGSLGDASPLYLIARELGRRGHEVILVALPGFEKDPGDQFEVVIAPPDLGSGLAAAREVSTFLSRTWMGRSYLSWRSFLPLLLRRTRWIHAFVKMRHAPRRTVVLARSGLFGARIARESLDVRLVTVHHTPAALRSRYESFVLPVPAGANVTLRFVRDLLWRGMDGYLGSWLRSPLNAYRRDLTLPPIRRLFDKWAFSPDLNLALFPEWFARPQVDWPFNTRCAGFPIPEDRPSNHLSSAVLSFLDNARPFVVFTRGSHSGAGAVFFRMARAVCRQNGFRGLILGVAPGSVPEHSHPSVLQVEFAPLASVLLKASVLVHHGGVGTCALAFQAGVPQFIIPGIGDQWEQARRVARLGCGIYLHPNRLSTANLTIGLLKLMGDQVTRARCAHIAGDFRNDGIANAALLVEAFGRETQSTIPGTLAPSVRGDVDT